MRSLLNRSKNLLIKYRYETALVFLFAICETFVMPLGNFPLNDDWSYANSVKILSENGRIDIGAWPSMTLLTHIVYGYLFTSLFGFSFSVLRLSTLLSALAGI